MYNKIRHVMASFKELKNKLQRGDKQIANENSIKETKLSTPQEILELEEARYLLALVAKSDFSGKDIQIVYNVAFKLQKIIENILNIEDVKNNG